MTQIEDFILTVITDHPLITTWVCTVTVIVFCGWLAFKNAPTHNE